jgi:hypothetical protein
VINKRLFVIFALIMALSISGAAAISAEPLDSRHGIEHKARWLGQGFSFVIPYSWQGLYEAGGGYDDVMSYYSITHRRFPINYEEEYFAYSRQLFRIARFETDEFEKSEDTLIGEGAGRLLARTDRFAFAASFAESAVDYYPYNPGAALQAEIDAEFDKLSGDIDSILQTFRLIPASAAEAIPQGEGYGYIIMRIYKNTMNVNGVTVEVDPGYETAPIIIDGRTMIPARALAEAMGGAAAWNEAAQEVTLSVNEITVVMRLGQKEYTRNGERLTMDAAPTIIRGRTRIPLRFASEALGCSVEWFENEQDILIIFASSAL